MRRSRVRVSIWTSTCSSLLKVEEQEEEVDLSEAYSCLVRVPFGRVQLLEMLFSAYWTVGSLCSYSFWGGI